MSSKVEFRFSNVEPPAEDPPKTIYTDIVGLTDPVYLGLSVRIFNYDDVGLYMRMDGSGTGWTFSTVNLGLLASGANMYRNLDNFANRAKPAAAVTETLLVRLRAYTDAGYTNLKWTYEKIVDVVFIKSDDGSWTQDFLNNFDDGTVQGWAVANEAGNDGGWPTIAVVSTYVLSPPYSISMGQLRTSGGPCRARFYKSFTTPDKNQVLAIINLRIWANYSGTGHPWSNCLEIRQDVTTLIHIGRELNGANPGANQLPEARWIKLVAKLTRNVTQEVRAAVEFYSLGAGATYVFMDDFMIVSKD